MIRNEIKSKCYCGKPVTLTWDERETTCHIAPMWVWDWQLKAHKKEMMPVVIRYKPSVAEGKKYPNKKEWKK